MKLHKYNIEQLKDAVASSVSIRQSLKKLGISPAGGNYQTFKKAVKYYSIDTSHFLGKSHNKGRKFIRRDIWDYLNNKVPINSHRLKTRLLRENLKQYQCECCKLTTWLNSDIPLELHHNDGNPQNNNINNLRLLCPNCHAFTDNYRGKNISS